MDKSCINCIYYEPHYGKRTVSGNNNSSSGECRRHAPKMIGGTVCDPCRVWPLITSDIHDWCGEFVSKQKEDELKTNNYHNENEIEKAYKGTLDLKSAYTGD